MATETWVTMLVIMGVIWGGFGMLIVLALRKERAKTSEAEGATRT